MPSTPGHARVHLSKTVDNPVEQDSLVQYKLLGTTALQINKITRSKDLDNLELLDVSKGLIFNKKTKEGTGFSTLTQLIEFIEKQPDSVFLDPDTQQVDPAIKQKDLANLPALYKAGKLGFERR